MSTREDPYLLHMFNPTKNVSPFDVNMAYEADFDGVIPYTEVTLDDIYALTQDTIFSRGPKGVKRTSIFIGGRELGLAIDMLYRAKAAMVPPFEISVFADPSGAITTAAAAMAMVEHWMLKTQGIGFEGQRLYVMGGTGPVGVCGGIIAANAGADVHLVSHRGYRIASDYASEYNNRFGLNMKGADGSSLEAVNNIVKDSEILIGAAKAGIRLLTKEQFEQAEKLKVAADINAVPPLGFEGIDVHDKGKVLDHTPNQSIGVGALAIGDIKYKVHTRLFEIMKTTDKPVYIDQQKAFEVAREVVKEVFDN